MAHKTKKIIGGVDVQTRGLIYLKDAEYIVKEVMKITEDTINENVANNVYENIETITKKALKEKLIQGKEDAYLSQYCINFQWFR